MKLKKSDGDWVYRRIECKVDGCKAIIEVRGDRPGRTPGIPWGVLREKQWVVSHPIRWAGVRVDVSGTGWGIFCPEHSPLWEAHAGRVYAWEKRAREGRKSAWGAWIVTPIRHLLGKFGYVHDEEDELPQPPWEVDP